MKKIKKIKLVVVIWGAETYINNKRKIEERGSFMEKNYDIVTILNILYENGKLSKKEYESALKNAGK